MNNNYTFITDNKIKIEAYLTSDNYLRIKCMIDGENITENPFKIDKAPQNDAPFKTVEKASIGQFIIRKEDRGYTLFDSKENKIYTSQIEISYDKDGKFVPIETKWDRVGLVQELLETRTYYGKYKFMGMGEAANTIHLNNNSYTFYHEADLGNQAKIFIPFYFSNTGFATYYNVNGRDTMTFTDKEDNTVVNFVTKQLYFDSYMYMESTPKEIVSRFYEFSNSKSLMPKWTYGYMQSKFGYETQEEIFELLKQIDEHKIEVSAIVIDLHWYKRMGDLDWNTDNFPDHKKMCEELKKRNIKLLTISQPFYTNGCKNYKEFEENKLFVQRTKEATRPHTVVWGDWWCRDDLYGSVINPIAPKAQQILGEKYVEMKSKGIDGFWLDLGEPENVPPQAYFNQYTEEEFHLHFADEWIKIIHSATKKAYKDYRTFILSRCGYTGTPKYNMAIWSGDSSATFTNLKRQVMIGVNSGITGYSNWGSDAGGFLSQLKLPNEEVYTRWMQFSLFTPMFRTHGKKTPREPWCYGGNTTDICVDLVNRRNNLLPYIYSSSYQTYKNGIPIMRALYMENPEDDNCFDIDDEFFFGDNILVAPILESMEENKTKEVYLPKGLWYDFYDLKPLQGGKIKVDVTIEKIPTYIKAGTITVTHKEIIVAQSENNNNKEAVWYIDDGETNNYLKGEFEEIILKLDNSTLKINNVKTEKTVNIKFVKTDGTITLLKDVLLKTGQNTIEL